MLLGFGTLSYYPNRLYVADVWPGLIPLLLTVYGRFTMKESIPYEKCMVLPELFKLYQANDI